MSLEFDTPSISSEVGVNRMSHPKELVSLCKTLSVDHVKDQIDVLRKIRGAVTMRNPIILE